MITGNNMTEISEPNSNKIEKRNSSKDQTMLEKSLDELDPFRGRTKSRTY
jgi:hypothetical protein